MSTQTPFLPLGKTIAAQANTSATLTIITADAPAPQLRFYNANGTIVYVALGSNAGNVVAAIPVPGTPGYGIPIPPQTEITLSTPMQAGPSGGAANLAISLINNAPANTSTSVVYVTPGEGFRG